MWQNVSFELVILVLSVACVNFSTATKDSSQSVVVDITHFSNHSCDRINQTTLECRGRRIAFSNWTRERNTSRHYEIEHLIVVNFPHKVLNPTRLTKLPNLRRFEVQDSAITHFSNTFPSQLVNLREIIINGTHLEEPKRNLFRNLPALRRVELRNNWLKTLEQPLNLTKNMDFELYLANNAWNCSTNMTWMISAWGRAVIKDLKELVCKDKLFAARPVEVVMDYKKTIQADCKREELAMCNCSLYWLVRNPEGTFTPRYEINCERQGLKILPSYLPANTTKFVGSKNLISDLLPLVENSVYTSVEDVYLDYNKITTVEDLEDSDWLKSFRVLSLRGNRLKTIPTHSIANAFEKNKNVQSLFLSQNPWTCDCIFTPRFQTLLIKHTTVIGDARNITCKYIQGDELSGKSIFLLTRTDLCSHSDEDSPHPLDILNCVLAFLIFLVLSKLAFDYYHYKRYGVVPWVVTALI